MTDDTARTNEQETPRNGEAQRPRWLGRLSAKLLLLTVVFVMLAEVLVFLPSVANFRWNWLMERLGAAQIAALAAQSAGDNRLPKAVHDKLLKSLDVHSLAMKQAEQRRLILQADMPSLVEDHFDLRETNRLALIRDALAVYFTPQMRYISVMGNPPFDSSATVEVVISEAPLRAAMVGFALNILGLSILISIITATLVYLTLNAMLVRPITQLTENMVSFSDDPENEQLRIRPTGRRDEIGVAEQELAAMQHQIADSLKEKSRLAALGLAVSKINHDLRNMLANAQLISDRFAMSKDPVVQRFTPKLIGSLDRAIRLCSDTLKYGKAQERPPDRARRFLRPLVDEVAGALGLPREGKIGWNVDMADDLEVDADHDHLYRVLSNLCRNAMQALEQPHPAVAMDAILVKAWREGAVVTIVVEDTGPGVPPHARDDLFKAFHGSGRKGSTGLGLAIAAELVGAHGGVISLVESAKGACFHITIPDRVEELRTAGKRSA